MYLPEDMLCVQTTLIDVGTMQARLSVWTS